MTAASICPLPPKWYLVLCPRSAHPLREGGTPCFCTVLCHRQSPPPPRVIWSLQPPWELDVPTPWWAAPETPHTEAACLEADVRRASLVAGAGVSGQGLPWGRGPPQEVHSPRHPARARSSCAERDEWHSCVSRALPEDYKAQALAALPAQRGGERASLGPLQGRAPPSIRRAPLSLPAARLRAVPVQPRAWPLRPHFSPRSRPEAAGVGGGWEKWSPIPSLHTHTPPYRKARRPAGLLTPRPA